MTDAWLLDRGRDGAIMALLLAGHALGDFVFQSGLMARSKDRLTWLFAHAAILFSIQTAALLPFLSPRVLAAVVAIVALHAGIDRLKAWCERRWPRPLLHFLWDQALHACVLFGAWAAVTAPPEAPALFALTDSHLRGLTTAAVVIAAYAVNGNGAATFVAGLLRRYHLQADSDAAEIEAERIARGRAIGILERMLALTLVLVGQWGALGLIMAAKSIARFKDLERRAFSEYYLIGTLASILFAAATGILVRLLV